MDNYIEYKLSKVKARMKKDVVPHIFRCQPDKQASLVKPSRILSQKRHRKAEIAELIKSSRIKTNTAENSEQIETEIEPPLPIQPVYNDLQMVHVASQTKLVHFRSKSIQVNMALTKHVATSPIKITITETNIPSKKRLETNIRSNKRLRYDSEESTVDEIKKSEKVESDFELYQVSQSSSSSSISETHYKVEEGGSKQFRKAFIKIMEKKLRMYTGIPKIHLQLISTLQVRSGLKRHSIFLILYKIKSSESFAKIGDLFEVSAATASRIFCQGIESISILMKNLVYWPDKMSIKRNLPIQFRATFSSVQSIIDCLEIEIQKPTKAVHQSLTWSEYKKCNTIKFLVSSTPDGFINFVSCGYGGRITDVALLEDCGYLDVLPGNCVVMADRGFKQIETLLNKNKCTLIRPPSVSTKEKMTKEEVILTKRIASVRIHIERIIKRIRDFKLLSPHATVNSELVQTLDYAMIIACAIINLQNPIIKK